jgi:Leucine-rich repeat (LRR) protein
MRYSVLLNIPVALSSQFDLTLENFELTLQNYVLNVENSDILYLMRFTSPHVSDDDVNSEIAATKQKVKSIETEISRLPKPRGMYLPYRFAHTGLRSTLDTLLGKRFIAESFPYSQESIEKAISDCDRCDEPLKLTLQDLKMRIFRLRAVATKQDTLPRILLHTAADTISSNMIAETRKLQGILGTFSQITQALKEGAKESAIALLATLEQQLGGYLDRQSFYWRFQYFLENEQRKLPSTAATPVNEFVPVEILRHTMSFMTRIDGVRLLSSLVSKEEDQSIPKMRKICLSKEETKTYLTDQSFFEDINSLKENPETVVELHRWTVSATKLTFTRRTSALTQAFGLLTNLQTLDLSETRVMDISALGSLTNLRVLDLSSTAVMDLNVLTSLTDLRTLVLSHTPVVDISALASLRHLENLSLGHTPVVDISALESLTKLSDLDLGHTNVMYISTLASLKNMWRLELRRTPIVNISALAWLPKLTFLVLSHTAVDDISCLRSRTSLQGLYLRNTSVVNISALASLTNLWTLDLADTAVADVSALASLTNLTHLMLDHTPVVDVSVLASLNPRLWISGKVLASIDHH